MSVCSLSCLFVCAYVCVYIVIVCLSACSDADYGHLNLELKQIMDKIRTLGLSKKQDKTVSEIRQSFASYDL